MATSSPTRPHHLKESNLQDFLSADFSPINYLNATLPSHAPSTSIKSSSSSLSTLASQTQSHIASLTAQSTRLSATLTALTDDILRISPRLAYEVELVRGEALSLSDSLSQSGDLHSAISQFVPQGVENFTDHIKSQIDESSDGNDVKPLGEAVKSSPSFTTHPHGSEPPIAHLRTLIHVRNLLTTVTQAFSLAMSWPLPPSSLSGPSASLISVSSPADPSLEVEGQEACSRMRREIMDLLDEGEGMVGGKDGWERAAERVQELRDSVAIWKGTREERARDRFVDGLEAMVEERIKKQPRPWGGKVLGGVMAEDKGVEGKTAAAGVGPGLLRNLQRLREEIYME